MPSSKCQTGDTVIVRGEVLRAECDAFQAFDDGVTLAITTWVPAWECAKQWPVLNWRVAYFGQYLPFGSEPLIWDRFTNHHVGCSDERAHGR